MEEIRTYFIGVDGEQVVDSKTTIQQMAVVNALECDLYDQDRQLTWLDLDNPSEPRTIFQSILGDRKMRVDEHTLMADRPSFAIVTAIGNRAVRCEYYEGHDSLSLVYDLRAKEIHGKDLPNFMDKDPQAYDPVKFLKDTFGIPEKLSKPILDAAHKK